MKREERTGEWRKLHNEELHNLYSSRDITMIKRRRRRWAGHVAPRKREKGRLFQSQTLMQRDDGSIRWQAFVHAVMNISLNNI
jgi:hypothetical protein